MYCHESVRFVLGSCQHPRNRETSFGPGCAWTRLGQNCKYALHSHTSYEWLVLAFPVWLHLRLILGVTPFSPAFSHAVAGRAVHTFVSGPPHISHKLKAFLLLWFQVLKCIWRWSMCCTIVGGDTWLYDQMLEKSWTNIRCLVLFKTVIKRTLSHSFFPQFKNNANTNSPPALSQKHIKRALDPVALNICRIRQVTH